MRRFLVFSITLMTICYSFGQKCGTSVTAEDLQYEKTFQNFMSSLRINGDATYSVAITPHVVRRTDGTGGLTEQQIVDAVEDLNAAYVGTQIRFYISDGVNFIDSDEFYDFDSSQEGNFAPNYNVTKTINIYFFNSLSSGGSPLCGYTYLPSQGKNLIMMANSCTLSGGTLPHEMGHFFNLYHTHGTTNTGTTDELVDGSNCETNGDRICDTPADPNLSGVVDSSVCAYAGTETDANGEKFKPDPRNFMSYATNSCLILFTQGQKDRMLAAYLGPKSSLLSNEMNVDFNLSNDKVCIGETVYFTNLSRGVESISWEFEGGTPATSSSEMPSVLFNTAGSYTVKLTGTDVESNVYEYEREINVYDPQDLEYIANLPYTESFEDNSSLPEIINLDNDITFKRRPDDTNDGSFSFTIDQYYNNNIGSEDYLLLPTFSASSDYYQFRFSYAYKQSISGYDDKLEIVYREDCGEWSAVWSKEGADLATNNNLVIARFLPSEQDWVREDVEFSINESAEFFEVAIRATSGLGNSIYIDNLELAVNDPTFSISDINVANVTCPGDGNGNISVETSGGLSDLEYSLDGESFQLDNSFENLSEGSFDVYVRNPLSGITETETIVISSQAIYPNTPSLFLNGNGELVANASLLPGQSFEWLYEGEIIEDEDRSSIDNPSMGAYQVGVTNGICTSYSDVFTVLSSGNQSESLAKEAHFYPNPVSNFIELNNEVDNYNVVLVDLSGKTVLRSDGRRIVDLSSLKSGTYIIMLGNFTKRLIKN
ncbi:M43 family zinc metalloprotease [Ekhidna sp.]|uniref:M43 family zinc metalloprotease n=1 Tax=Ekhidna sp. TaxID=2608089 RepID=UPI003C7DB521